MGGTREREGVTWDTSGKARWREESSLGRTQNGYLGDFPRKRPALSFHALPFLPCPIHPSRAVPQSLPYLPRCCA